MTLAAQKIDSFVEDKQFKENLNTIDDRELKNLVNNIESTEDTVGYINERNISSLVEAKIFVIDFLIIKTDVFFSEVYIRFWNPNYVDVYPSAIVYKLDNFKENQERDDEFTRQVAYKEDVYEFIDAKNRYVLKFAAPESITE